MSFSAVTAGIGLGNRLLDLLARFIPDPQEAAKVALEIERMAADNSLAQIEVNKLEATSSSFAIAGWRPAVGWAGVAALVWNFLIAPVATWILQLTGSNPPPLPVLDETMGQILIALLGINIGARTYEKVNRVAS